MTNHESEQTINDIEFSSKEIKKLVVSSIERGWHFKRTGESIIFTNPQNGNRFLVCVTKIDGHPFEFVMQEDLVDKKAIEFVIRD
jgi:hypothetical protein